MRVHYLQHVPFEGLAGIEAWVQSKGHSLSVTRFFNGESLPDVKDIDWLIVMGGPMNIYEHEEYPWLVQEKRFISQAIHGGKTVLGICLGAQLIADVLGAEVTRNQYKEIGWLPVKLTEEAMASTIFGFLPKEFTVFHWHGDTFDLPPGVIRLASSEGCLNQAFLYDDRVLGLQFHMESTTDSIEEIVRNCGSEIVQGKYIQKPEEILGKAQHVSWMNDAMSQILDLLPVR